MLSNKDWEKYRVSIHLFPYKTIIIGSKSKMLGNATTFSLLSPSLQERDKREEKEISSFARLFSPYRSLPLRFPLPQLAPGLAATVTVVLLSSTSRNVVLLHLALMMLCFSSSSKLHPLRSTIDFLSANFFL